LNKGNKRVERDIYRIRNSSKVVLYSFCLRRRGRNDCTRLLQISAFSMQSYSWPAYRRVKPDANPTVEAPSLAMRSKDIVRALYADRQLYLGALATRALAGSLSAFLKAKPSRRTRPELRRPSVRLTSQTAA